MAQSAEIGAGLGQPLLLDDWFAAARADIALCAGDVHRATTLAAKAAAAAERADGLFSGGIAHRVWAQALAAADPPRWDEAEVHVARGLELLEAGAARLPAAHAHLAWSPLCRARGDRASAREHVACAAAQFEASGLEPELAMAGRGR
jgi:hypothetical protein